MLSKSRRNRAENGIQTSEAEEGHKVITARAEKRKKKKELKMATFFFS